MTVLCVVIISHQWFHDYPYIFEQLKRAASLYHHVKVVHGGGDLRYEMYIHDWLRGKPEFTEVIHRANVHRYGYGGDPHQASKMLDEDPDEIWKFETSPGSRRRPDHAIFPDVWYKADYTVLRRRFNSGQKRRSHWTGSLYDAQMDSDGFPMPVRLRVWDAETNGVDGPEKGVQRYSNTPIGRKQRALRRRTGEYRNPKSN